jgi:hypothetical protein
MKTTALSLGAIAVVALLGLAACHPPHIHHREAAKSEDDGPVSVAATLTCPQTIGGLTRTAQAADGQSCDYTGRGDLHVSLRRLVLSGAAPTEALAPVEASLRPLIVARAGPSPIDIDSDDDDDDDDDHDKVDLPGIHVDAHGDEADVRVLGVTVHADGDKADVDVGKTGSHATVLAGPAGAEIRSVDIDDDSANLVLVLASDKPGPSGDRAAGYVARGPVKGPLVAAVFHASRGHADWRGNRDLNGLLDLNVKQ